MTNEEIYNDKDIELIINTTYHMSHYEVSKAAKLASKHVHSEKMIALDMEQANEFIRISKETGKYLAAAPDTFLSAGLQTARRVIETGLIGTPVAADIVLVRGYRHQNFRTDAERRFAFMPGGGIIFDAGCYYLSGLVSLMGPIGRVSGFSQTGDPYRTYMHPDNPLYKKEMLVEIPNNFSGALEFKNGVLCSILISSEGINVTNHFTVYGSTGALTFNDPNEFGRPLYLKCKGDKEAREIPLTNTYNINMRGLRAADLAYAIRNGRASGSSLEMVYHTFEAEIGICSSGEDNTTHIMQSTSERPKLLEMGNTEYPEIVLDL